MEPRLKQQALIRLDAICRTVTVGGHREILREKTWQVLALLVARAPEVVSREDFISAIWFGNALVGEKGLNQAIWIIRAVLADDARTPSRVRTIPRAGYQWIAVAPTLSSDPTAARTRHRLVALSGIAATLAVVVAGAALLAGSADTPMVATSAYLVGKDVHIEFESGCLGIIRNADGADIRAPVLSNDGSEIAVSVYEGNQCRLVMIDLSTRERSDFAQCPVPQET
jgi:DNA-binding winged helix-turn-helix (wHTH) protein